MDDPLTIEQAFVFGCSSMQVQIATWLLFKGYTELSADVLEMQYPKFNPEKD